MRDGLLSFTRRQLGWSVLLGLLLLSPASNVLAQTNTRFVVINQTGHSDAQVHMKFLGPEIGASATAQTYGPGHPLHTGSTSSSYSYSLQEMRATVPNTPYASISVPTFAINDFLGGRIYFSIGFQLESVDPPAAGTIGAADYNVVYHYVETYTGGSGANNIDVSYVDFVGIPIDMAARNGNGTLYSYPSGKNPQSSAAGSTMFDHLITSGVPASAIAPAVTGGTARISSPSLGGVTGYHDWTALFTYLKNTWTSPISVASYKVPVGEPLSTVLFGYSGGGIPVDPFDPLFLIEQDYSFTATVMDDLNPGGANARIPGLAGIAGVKLHGAGGTYGATTGTGAFDIYIQQSDLDAPTGIYGNNPAYTVDWTGRPVLDGGPIAFPASTGIVDDLTGRIVGDLLAGITFGWTGNATNIANHATATSFDLPTDITEERIGDLGTGKYFYLLSLQDSTAKLAEWFGSGISATPDFYDTYGNAFAADTTAYTMPFGDRLQGSVTPSIWWDAAGLAGQDGYLEITLLPGAYAAPEPASVSLLLSAWLALAAIARRAR